MENNHFSGQAISNFVFDGGEPWRVVNMIVVSFFRWILFYYHFVTDRPNQLADNKIQDELFIYFNS